MASSNTPGSLQRLHFGSLSRQKLCPSWVILLKRVPKKGELDQESGSQRARWGEAARPGWGRQVLRRVWTRPGSTPCPFPMLLAPRMQIAALHGPGARCCGPARGRGRRPPPRAAPRAHLGRVAILLRRVLPRLEQRSAGRWQRQLRECLPWRRRKEGDPGFPGGPGGADARDLGGRWFWPRLGQDGESRTHAHR